MTYLDAASAEPLNPAGEQALVAALRDGWADPSRLYRAGRRARLALDTARQQVGEAIGARPDELAFTGSGTLACHLAVLGTLSGRRRVGAHVVVSAVEHSSVLHAATEYAGEVTTVPVDRLGRVDPGEFTAAVRRDTALACLQSANHEVGTVQPVAEVASRCAELGVPLFVDAAQSVGWAAAPEGWSLLAASAHKWGGPPGVGVLAIRRRVRWRSPLPEDEREGGRSPGFENIPAIVAAAAALRMRLDGIGTEAVRLSAQVDRIRATVPALIPDVEVVGDPAHRLPHLVTFSCLYVDGEALVTELDRLGFAVNSGSSCTSSTLRPSHVLEAMGVLSHGNVRVSLPVGTTDADVDGFLGAVPEVVRRLRAVAGAEGL